MLLVFKWAMKTTAIIFLLCLVIDVIFLSRTLKLSFQSVSAVLNLVSARVSCIRSTINNASTMAKRDVQNLSQTSLSEQNRNSVTEPFPLALIIIPVVGKFLVRLPRSIILTPGARLFFTMLSAFSIRFRQRIANASDR